MQIQTGNTQGAGGTWPVAAQQGGPLSTLRPGDILEGEVLSFKNGQVQLRLADGSTMRAHVGEGIELAAGQQVQLSLAEHNSNLITMKLLGNAGGHGVQMELSKPEMVGGDARNQQTFNLMRAYGMSPSKENLQKIEQLLQRFPTMDLRTATFVASNLKLPPDAQEGWLRALADVLIAKPGLQNPLQALTDLLSIQAGQASGGDKAASITLPPQMAQVLGEALALLGESLQQTQGGQQAQGAMPAMPTPQASVAALVRYLQQAAPEGLATLQAAGQVPDAAALLMASAKLPAEQMSQALGAFVAQLPEQPADLMPAMQRALSALHNLPTEAVAQGVGEQPDNAAAMTRPAPGQQIARPIAPQMVAPQGPPTQSSAAMPLPQLGVMQGATPTAQPPVAGMPTAAALLAQVVASAGGGAQSGADVTQLLARAQSLFAQLSFDVGGAANGRELQRAVSGLIENLGQLREMAGTPQGSAAAALAYQAEARAQALPQIAQFTYVQVPVQLRDRHENADLYFMRRPSKKKGDQDEYTVLLALETLNMGRVETVIRAQDTDVSLNFRMDEGLAAGAVRAGFPSLNDSLAAMGYLLKETSVTPLDAPVTPQTFEALIAQMSAPRQTLDLSV